MLQRREGQQGREGEWFNFRLGRNRFGGHRPRSAAFAVLSLSSNALYSSALRKPVCWTAMLFGITHINTHSLTELAYVANRQQPFASPNLLG